MKMSYDDFIIKYFLPGLLTVAIAAVIFAVYAAVFIEPEQINRRKEACEARNAAYLRHTEMVGKTTNSVYYCIRWPALIELKDEEQ